MLDIGAYDGSNAISMAQAGHRFYMCVCVGAWMYVGVCAWVRVCVCVFGYVGVCVWVCVRVAVCVSLSHALALSRSFSHFLTHPLSPVYLGWIHKLAISVCQRAV